MSYCIRQPAPLVMTIILGLFAILNIQSCSSHTSARPERVDAKPVTGLALSAELAARLREGVDVSEHSGAIDWVTLLDEGYSFAFVKATEGIDLRDSSFDDHWGAMKQAGLIRGAYHFYVTEDDPHEQAKFFTGTVALEPGDLAPVVDVELMGHDTTSGLPDRLKIWLGLVERHYGVKPIIYTNANFWDEHLNSKFGDYPLWIAEYDVEKPRLPAGWSVWTLWQWKGDADLPGVEKGADLSRVNRNGLDLSKIIIPQR